MILQLERAADAITKASIRACGGEPAADPHEVEQLAAALRTCSTRCATSDRRAGCPCPGTAYWQASRTRSAPRAGWRAADLMTAHVHDPGGLELRARDRNGATGAG